MNTHVFFIRHAEPDYTVHEDAIRPLTAKGQQDAEALVGFFTGIPVDHIYASPFLRALDTVRPLAAHRRLTIETVEDFRERKVDTGWIEDFRTFSKRQWADFEYKLIDGECLAEVQRRNVRALVEVLKRHPGRHIVIGTHGTALSTLLHHYDPAYGYDWFERIRTVMPLVVKATFMADGSASIPGISMTNNLHALVMVKDMLERGLDAVVTGNPALTAGVEAVFSGTPSLDASSIISRHTGY